MTKSQQIMENNVHALEKFGLTYPNLRIAIEDKPEAYSYLVNILHFACVRCGGRVTSNNIKFCGYSANTHCINCQYVPKFNSTI